MIINIRIIIRNIKSNKLLINMHNITELEELVSLISKTEINESSQQEGRNSGNILVIDFFAEWCGPCKRLTPYLQKLDEEHDNCIVCKVDVDQAQDISERFKVTCMPTLIIIKNKQVLKRIEGFNPEELYTIVRDNM